MEQWTPPTPLPAISTLTGGSDRLVAPFLYEIPGYCMIVVTPVEVCVPFLCRLDLLNLSLVDLAIRPLTATGLGNFVQIEPRRLLQSPPDSTP